MFAVREADYVIQIFDSILKYGIFDLCEMYIYLFSLSKIKL